MNSYIFPMVMGVASVILLTLSIIIANYETLFGLLITILIAGAIPVCFVASLIIKKREQNDPEA